ncbi:MAG: hypothetical protein A2845_03425 [Candidatus Lloydbacteria bacterium RIFCSPHIGHO2_01_FULL_49_22]|uniref:NodB homology domain-containing protein n=1 Tax=Candidatus Lloydbacteria bacterium RIFCSPHIGHO2_01_FULL_49_22 TaxID=1798658 RepID=A0A1G2CWP3_9BACT|nr:MAG: hypothetical protein A2845_03425 [Candidatus Lloydbacteria bacterium RIFCSPHIGHO2_01_FULL_49_22]OGZ08982.1 MAG: hypothetical protein A3C14_03260 [Candidatus Lloydbacteria bacterium RIFCSPHIGHO2_02_FULL_50_18]
MKFLITVDTEADNQWRAKGPLTLRSIEKLPHFQEVAEHYGFRPTYFITHEVATNKEVTGVMRELEREGKSEVGAHLHPWTTPPYFDESEERHLKHFPCELNDEFLKKKFEVLHDAITTAMGHAPTSFRAGRWGYDGRLDPLLAEHGYVADSSVSPYMNWVRGIKKGEGRKLPDFLDASPFPYISPRGIAEVPMSILPKDVAWISRAGARMLGRGSFRVSWCRIFSETSLEMLKDLYFRAEAKHLPYLVFMTHSSELLVGGSPYSKTPELVAHFNEVFEGFLDFLQKQGIAGATATEAGREILAESRA